MTSPNSALNGSPSFWEAVILAIGSYCYLKNDVTVNLKFYCEAISDVRATARG